MVREDRGRSFGRRHEKRHLEIQYRKISMEFNDENKKQGRGKQIGEESEKKGNIKIELC